MAESLFFGQSVLDVAEGGDGVHSSRRFRRRVLLRQGVALLVAVLEVLVVVEAPVVGGDAVEVAHVDGFGALLVGEQRLVHLLAVADADDVGPHDLHREELAGGHLLQGRRVENIVPPWPPGRTAGPGRRRCRI